MRDARWTPMETTHRWLVSHAHHLRIGWLVVLALLAACNNGGSDGGGY
jgi:hypothetical protein